MQRQVSDEQSQGKGSRTSAEAGQRLSLERVWESVTLENVARGSPLSDRDPELEGRRASFMPMYGVGPSCWTPRLVGLPGWWHTQGCLKLAGNRALGSC